jgi:hypothetical protein
MEVSLQGGEQQKRIFVSIGPGDFSFLHSE